MAEPKIKKILRHPLAAIAFWGAVLTGFTLAWACWDQIKGAWQNHEAKIIQRAQDIQDFHAFQTVVPDLQKRVEKLEDGQ